MKNVDGLRSLAWFYRLLQKSPGLTWLREYRADDGTKARRGVWIGDDAVQEYFHIKTELNKIRMMTVLFLVFGFAGVVISACVLAAIICSAHNWSVLVKSCCTAGAGSVVGITYVQYLVPAVWRRMKYLSDLYVQENWTMWMLHDDVIALTVMLVKTSKIGDLSVLVGTPSEVEHNIIPDLVWTPAQKQALELFVDAKTQENVAKQSTLPGDKEVLVRLQRLSVFSWRTDVRAMYRLAEAQIELRNS